MSQLPYAGLRIVEASATLSGRLVGLLFADQGAQVRCSNGHARTGQEADAYLDRGKQLVSLAALAETHDADVLIVDDDAPVPRHPSQIVLRIVAALPGDEAYGHLPANCSEDLLSATLGFFTDMALTGPALGRPVIYSPLPVSSVYTGVNGAVALGAALAQRLRTGQGCEITASRLAGGLSAIGALAVTNAGLPPHLAPSPRAPLSPEKQTQFSAILGEAAVDETKRSWLEHRMIPFGVPYRAADGRMVILINGVNRLATRRLYKALGIWDQLLAAGLVDISPYTPESLAVRGRNLADSPTLDFASASLVAELLEEIIATKTAAEWERELCGLGVAAAKVMSFDEWLHDDEARRAGLTAVLTTAIGDRAQLGRAAWLASAQPYPPLAAPAHNAWADAHATAALPSKPTPENTARPLQGRIVVDLTNVIAGPNCARMLGELGATVYRIEQPDPSHPPIAMTIWGAEAGAGKQSIILDILKPEGQAVLHALLARADFVVANKSDAQCQRLGIDVESLHALNPKAILVQLTAHHGERMGARHDYPGYDPTGQAITGIMLRFGTDQCPTYHGLASCVDYLTGYLGAWSAVTALYARERRADGRGDWAQTSLTAAASLMQLLFQFEEPPASACGPHATGPTAGRRTYRVTDGWIFAMGDSELTALLQGHTVASALDMLAASGVQAIRVNTVRELAAHHRTQPSRTIHFQAIDQDGWRTECFVPTWFCVDGAVPETRRAAVRIGSSAGSILQSLGMSGERLKQLQASGAVGSPEWARPAHA